MINIIVAYDELDAEIGYYCQVCKDNLESFLNGQNDIHTAYIANKDCHHAYISQKIEQQNFENFIFVGYSHGEQTGKSLLCNKTAYIDEYNAHLFKNTLFYAMACSIGAKLAHQLLENGCWAFIGFDKVVQVVKEYQHIAERCDNWGIILFLGTDISIGEAFNNMKQEFTKQIDILEDDDFGNVSWLIGNRDALVFSGNKNLTRKDFM